MLNAIHFPKHQRKYFRLSTETGGKYVGVGSTIGGSIIPDSATNFPEPLCNLVPTHF
jgi:hypothetical protein